MARGLFTLKQQLQGLQQKAWTGTMTTPAVDYLVVAGGGSSGGGLGSGGGAGGLLQGSVPVAAGSSITVTVGAGGAQPSGAGVGNNGTNSVFGSVTAIGGGGGGSWADGNGANGGSGGGQGPKNTGTPLNGQGIVGQGNAGGNGSTVAYGALGISSQGGGGAGTVGLGGIHNTNAAYNGGAGISSAINGTTNVFAGGGGGFQYGSSGSGGAGGVGGGGGGGCNPGTGGTGGTGYNSGTSGGSNSYNGGNGGANSGGGGGGVSVTNGGTGGIGGSGIVIVSYSDVYAGAAATTGSPTVSTSGSGSINFTGVAGATYIYYANQTPFEFGTGDWTIEFWVNPTVTAENEIVDFRPLNGTDGLYPTVYATLGRIIYYANNANRISGTTVLTNGTWYHVAVSKISNTTKLYLNGTQEGSSYSDTNNYLVGSNAPKLGARTTSSAGFNGLISNLRIVKGVGVYTGAFTPSTSPLQATQLAGTNIAAITGTSTSLLLNTVSGARTADGSTNGYAPSSSTTVTPAWNQASPFATGLGYKNRVYTWTSSGTVTF